MKSDDVIVGGIGCMLVTALCIVAVVVTLAGIGFLTDLTFESTQAGIEQLRRDAANVDPEQAEDVIGQVTETNRNIVTNQQWNRIPIAGFAIPDRWEQIEVIPVPKAN